ncbi:PAS domain-containing protein [Pelagibius litoralis]|uniref:PAS domain-containing protein n=1 Tax=Pelagibius litoralis TaxID=374515 RepID=A0A967EYL6_9PROT|nr:PAS domain-containing protein [Pelagibius litoralis]NIA69832.1 PAS domain-containing protein [Pelagibius litoralis]
MQFLNQLGEPLLVELYQYWLARCDGRRAPARADIDPIDIPKLLPYVTLTEVLGDGARFRYRLAGTKVEERFGCSLTNCFVEDLMQGAYLTYVQDLYKKLLASFAPLYSESSFGLDRTPTFRAKRLMLPLSDNQQSANMVLSGMLYVPADPNDRSTVLRSLDRFNPPGRGAL